MFTVQDYELLRESSQRANALGGAWEVQPEETAAGRKLTNHLKAGLPKPEGVPDSWWNYESEIFEAWKEQGFPTS